MENTCKHKGQITIADMVHGEAYCHDCGRTLDIRVPALKLILSFLVWAWVGAGVGFVCGSYGVPDWGLVPICIAVFVGPTVVLRRVRRSDG